MNDGGAFANNTAWLSALLARECNCQGFIFWNVGTSYLLSGGSDSELYKITKKVEAYIAEMEVHIRGTLVNLKHNFVHVQLVYNKVALKKDLMEMNASKRTGTPPSSGSHSSNSSTTTVLSLIM